MTNPSLVEVIISSVVIGIILVSILFGMNIVHRWIQKKVSKKLRKD